MLQDISQKKVEMKPYFSPEVSNLLSKLLERDPAKRIGCTETDADEIRAHPWFSDINWEKVSTMTHEAIFKPKVKGAEDVSCIDKLFTKEGL
jgi:serine/threonine protein kinase